MSKYKKLGGIRFGELIEFEVIDWMRFWGLYYICRFYYVVLYIFLSIIWNGIISEI